MILQFPHLFQIPLHCALGIERGEELRRIAQLLEGDAQPVHVALLLGMGGAAALLHPPVLAVQHARGGLGQAALTGQRQLRLGQRGDVIGEKLELRRGDAGGGGCPGLVARFFRAGAQQCETFDILFVRHQQFADKHIQVAGRGQAPGQDLGAATQLRQPFLVEFPSEGAQRHFQPAKGDTQLMQAFHRTAHPQGGGIGGDLRQAIGQGGAKGFLGPHGGGDIGGHRLDRLDRANIAAGKGMNGDTGIVHGPTLGPKGARHQSRGAGNRSILDVPAARPRRAPPLPARC